MKKSTLLSGLAGALVLFVINGAFYGFSGVMDSYLTDAGQATQMAEPNFVPLVLGHLVIGVLSAMLYSKWARGTHSFSHGAQFGVLLGALLGIGLGMIYMATTTMMTSTGHIIDGLWTIAVFALVGGIISIVTGKFETAE